MNEKTNDVEEFFDRYAAALLARDATSIAGMYTVPSLILFPGNSIPVTDEKQTEQFLATTWPQYEGSTRSTTRSGSSARRPTASGPTSPGAGTVSPANASAINSSMWAGSSGSRC
jgi:hypothetical protein